MFIRAYLCASTSEQDASRARGALDAFAVERGLAGQLSCSGPRVLMMFVMTFSVGRHTLFQLLLELRRASFSEHFSNLAQFRPLNMMPMQ